MKLYRAVARQLYEEGKIIRRNPGRRLPSNIPYLVDNLLEFARPSDKPSRRHSVYASPTPQLALQYAVAGGADRAAYLVCELRCKAPPAIMQLTSQDAKLHTDVLHLQQFVNDRVRDMSMSSIEDKLNLAPLCLPGVLKEELLAAMEKSPFLHSLVTDAAETVTFWNPAPQDVSPDGELFFELTDDNYFTQHPV
ncbi:MULTISPECIES: hypothetical protein [unclassified Undibacterium]|uniref:hypothetical protein n=1 Tax=unclassified Undibacterium TaxID=2630295 RepID=UPI003C2C768D